MRPLDPVTSKQRAAYGFAFFVLFVALWAWATFGGYVSKTFLANPLSMLQEGFDLLTKHGFLFDIGMTIWRVIGASAVGTMIEWYDFYIFGSLATTIAPLFYPPENQTFAYIAYLATFAVGFIVRPFGDLYRLGVPDYPDDRRERRQHQARPR